MRLPSIHAAHRCNGRPAGVAPSSRRHIAIFGAALAAALCFGAPPPLGALAAGTPSARIAYGEVVAASSRAITLSLADGAWVSVNAAPRGTTVFGPSSAKATAADFTAIVTGDYAVVYYTIFSRRVDGHVFTWFLAKLAQYAATPFAIGGPAHVAGVVTGVFTQGFTLRTRAGRVWLVYVSPETGVRVGGSASAFAFLQRGDRAVVVGVVAGGTLSAETVTYAVANTGG